MKIQKIIFLLLILFCGCNTTPIENYRIWYVKIYAPSGKLHKTYEIASVDYPEVWKSSVKQTVYAVNRNPTLIESELKRTSIEVPTQWLIEIEKNE